MKNLLLLVERSWIANKLIGLSSNFLVALIVGASALVTTAILLRILYTGIRSLILTAPPVWRIAILLGLVLAPLTAGTVLALLTGISSFDYVVDFITHHCHVANAGSTCLPHVQFQLDPLLELSAILVVTGLVAAAAATVARQVAKWNRIKKSLLATSRYCEKLEAHIIDDDRSLALCAGILKPMVFISNGLMRRLTPMENKIVLAHEQAHARRHDGLLQSVVRCVSICHLPSMRRQLLDDLGLATEQACDDEAARRTNGRLAVAEVIIKVERLHHHRQWDNLSSVVTLVGSSVPARIEYLLNDHAPFSRKRLINFVVRGAVFAAALIICAEPLHHTIESVTLSLMG